MRTVMKIFSTTKTKPTTLDTTGGGTIITGTIVTTNIRKTTTTKTSITIQHH